MLIVVDGGVVLELLTTKGKFNTWVKLLDLALITTVVDPVAARLDAFRVKVVVAGLEEFLVFNKFRLGGLKEAVRPVGNPVTDKATDPEKPFKLVTVNTVEEN